MTRYNDCFGVPVCVNDFKKYMEFLPKSVRDYYGSGSDDELTLNSNEKAYLKYFLFPRVLRDVSTIDLRCTINLGGLQILTDSPIWFAPTAFQKLAHPDGEIAVASAARSRNIVNVLSSWSTTSLEDAYYNSAGSKGLFFLQLYVYKDRSVVIDLLKRAERTGYTAVAVTVDTPRLGTRRNDVRNSFTLPPHLSLANFTTNITKLDKLQKESGLAAHVASLTDPSLSWDDIDWLSTITTMKIIVKGIIHPEDAKIALEHSVHGIIVSNHGGRQLDSCISTIDALPAVVTAVNNRIPVFLDGGIRSGNDVAKALCMGACAVFVGRPCLYGLTYNGQPGVELIHKILHEELYLTMSLLGCTKLSRLGKEYIFHISKL
eukprot:NODE_965_length_2714_cov_0.239006.p1 type:complete len:375 gc:universal NODE_965_length_2714_cov_0.239006:2026-902(-)